MNEWEGDWMFEWVIDLEWEIELLHAYMNDLFERLPALWTIEEVSNWFFVFGRLSEWSSFWVPAIEQMSEWVSERVSECAIEWLSS